MILSEKGALVIPAPSVKAKGKQPHEKVLTEGFARLSLLELVQVILDNGTIGKGPSDVAQRVAHGYGDKGLASLKDPIQVAEVFDIPLQNARRIVAAVELGRRFFDRASGRASRVRNAKEVSLYVHDMHEFPRECLRGIYVNGQHQIVHEELLSMGTLDSNLTHPREIFRPALEHSASGIILVHNHPSGFIEASPADIEVTKQLVEAGKLMGVAILDHVIVGKGKYGSVPVIYE